jgi:hypothetical protein
LRPIGESLENADYSAISGKDSDSDDGYRGKSHYENNQEATQDRPTFPMNCRRRDSGILWRRLVCDPLSVSSIYPSLTLPTVNKYDT